MGAGARPTHFVERPIERANGALQRDISHTSESASARSPPPQSVLYRRMGNFPRYVPDGALVEVTTRTIHGRFLLRPSRDFNSIVRGVLGRAEARYEVGIVAFATLSIHWHLLLLPRDAEQLAAFMAYVNGNLAKEVGRLHQWKEKVWSRRYRAIVVSDEPEAQIASLRYLLEQGCKEGLVRSPRRWPGATSTEALLTGKAVTGWWFDRSPREAASTARAGKHGPDVSEMAGASLGWLGPPWSAGTSSSGLFSSLFSPATARRRVRIYPWDS